MIKVPVISRERIKKEKGPNEVKDLIIQRTDPCGIACAVRS